MLAIAACTGDSKAANAAPAAKPPDGGQVRLVDRGFSIFPGPAGIGMLFTPEAKAANRDYDMVSWGVLVENTSKWVATATAIDVDLVDATGTELTGTDYDLLQDPEVIVVLRPGERVGLGHTTKLRAPGDHPGKRLRRPADVRVRIGQSKWFPPGSPGGKFAKLTASELTTSIKPLPNGGDGFAVSFTIDSAYSDGCYVSATALFRNAAGEIIGGTSRDIDGSTDYPDRFVVPGRSRGDIRMRTKVPHVDPTQSAVYLHPVGTAQWKPC